MKKILIALPLLLTSCSYPWNSASTSIITPTKQVVATATEQVTNESNILVTQSEWTGTTKSKIIFKKDLSPSIHIVQDEENATVFFWNQKIASRSNIIEDTNFLDYHTIEADITTILKVNQIEPEKFTIEQKKLFGQIFAQKYFYLYTQNPYSEATPYTWSWINILTNITYEWPTSGWIIDENTNDILTFTWEIAGIKQIVHRNNWWYILGENAYGEAWEYLNFYIDNKDIHNIQLKQLSTETNEEYKQFDFISDKQIKIWYGPRKLEESEVTKKGNWKNYTISL